MSIRSTSAIAVFVVAISALCASFPRHQSPSLIPATRAQLTVSADLDGGGTPDLALIQDDRLKVTLSDSNVSIELSALPETTALAAADLDHDGDLDLISLGRDGVRGWINGGSGSFSAWTVKLSSQPIVPIHLEAVRWSPFGPPLLSAVTGRAAPDGQATAGLAASVPLAASADITAVLDRAPPQPLSPRRSPRAPPQLARS